ncbi:MAG: hypothetical protein GF416_02910 [Candidatus Altiarchaeales archaeon]|nr:hypothetical protein [Candidatus Altiarchaeales archaeon]MBD3416070.1 hypothetical protein [Candidatus Altiarchaeales archaeon]
MVTFSRDGRELFQKIRGRAANEVLADLKEGIEDHPTADLRRYSRELTRAALEADEDDLQGHMHNIAETLRALNVSGEEDPLNNAEEILKGGKTDFVGLRRSIHIVMGEKDRFEPSIWENRRDGGLKRILERLRKAVE